MKLEHIGIAVTDAIAAAAVLQQVLEMPVYKTEFVTNESVVTHFISTGNTKIELLESTNDGSALAKSIDSRGPGLHHLAFEVDDIDAAYSRVTNAGFTPLSKAPYEGADGKLVFFVHPRDTARVLIEFCQTNRPAGKTRTIADIDVIETGQFTAPLTIVLGFTATDPVVRPLEASRHLVFLPQESSLTASFVDEACKADKKYDVLVAESSINSIEPVDKFPLRPDSMVVVGSALTPPGWPNYARRCLVIADRLSDQLNPETAAHPDVSIAVVPQLHSAQERASIVAQIIRSFL
ncbi:MAG: methylmalonyl-CoA epimerase [Rhodothermales bacterium]|nr:methylmalonyl-CoA epimerase [Rhodothermales bacterium]